MKQSSELTMNPFGSAALALQSQPPQWAARMVSLGICAMVAMGVGFASVAKMDVVVSAQGKVVPPGKSKVVQPLESGVVRSIAVRDGQTVKAGEVLLELDPTNTDADRQRLQRDLWSAQADVLRVTRLLEGRAAFAVPDGMPAEIAANQAAMQQSRLAEQRARLAALDADVGKRASDTQAIANTIKQLRQSVPLIEQKNRMREDLAQTGHVARTSVMETQLELLTAQKELTVQGDRLQESQASHRAALEQRAQAVAEFRARMSTELVEAIKKRDALEQELVKTHQRLALQTLRAPIDGIVQQLAVSTVGGVVTAAQPLLTVVPNDSPLELEAQVLNRDVGQVRVGQRVINKVETFDFTRYGYIEGEVQWVGTDAVADPKLGLVYPVRIRLATLKTPQAVNGQHGSITAGMNVTADIRTDERRMIEYVLAPMLRYKQEAMRER